MKKLNVPRGMSPWHLFDYREAELLKEHKMVIISNSLNTAEVKWCKNKNYNIQRNEAQEIKGSDEYWQI